VNSAAAIETKMLESATLGLEIKIAEESARQAMWNYLSLRERAERLQAQQDRYTAYLQRQAYKALQFRVYANDLTLTAQRSFRQMLKWAFLATRAYEYERNVSYGPRETLWSKQNAREVAAYMAELKGQFATTGTTIRQHNVDVISVRDQLLELAASQTDAVTGRVVDPRERFRAYVRNPGNRDVNGNLRLSFMTYRPDKPIFSRNVCNDRITGIRINLVGSNFGAGVTTAYVRLTQSGTNYLRDCTTRELTSYNVLGADQKPRVAYVQAGLNSPAGSAGPSANTDLLDRALLAGPWELMIDQRPLDEPRNAKLDLNGLDDIELIFEHDSNTIQQ
jgi:hypothetical protein